MARRIELAAGIAAGVLDVCALLLLLLAPLVPVCLQTGVPTCPASSVRYVPLHQAGVSTAGWIYVLGLFALLLIAAAGALAEVRMNARWGAWVLRASGVLAFASCALGAGGVGLVYLPAMLSVCLAAYGSISGRLRPIQRSQPNVDMPDDSSISEKHRTSS
ncbi:MAG TPA: hypothetical protein VGP82_06435 [Ktedonobacterales bacterium]|jgi:hypothetical protein|nr:hypothetical protein [Ktedonobacterales bacterium]